MTIENIKNFIEFYLNSRGVEFVTTFEQEDGGGYFYQICTENSIGIFSDSTESGITNFFTINSDELMHCIDSGLDFDEIIGLKLCHEQGTVEQFCNYLVKGE